MDAGAFGGPSYSQYYPPNAGGGMMQGITPTQTVVDERVQPMAVGKGSVVGTLLALIVFLVLMRVVYELAS